MGIDPTENVAMSESPEVSRQDKKLPLIEVFGPTIQGEGAVIGQQTYFLRFGLCDYKCKLCDSMHAVDPAQVKANAQWLTQEDILKEFMTKTWKKHSTNWVCLSGGNPCVHDLSILVKALKKLDFKISVETQGTLAPSWLESCDIVTVSPKGPGMGENTSIEDLDRFLMIASQAYHIKPQMKVVIFDQRDIEFAAMLWERYQYNGYDWWLSLGNSYPPGYQEHNHPRNQTERMERLTLDYRLLFEDIKEHPILSKMRFLPQWHTFVWGNDKGK
jgi:7-carboxy-7-deazaguanine synthase